MGGTHHSLLLKTDKLDKILVESKVDTPSFPTKKHAMWQLHPYPTLYP